jgi:hypothetical protein
LGTWGPPVTGRLGAGVLPVGDLAAVAELFGFAGQLVPGVRWAGGCCTAVVRVDVAEVTRRQAGGFATLSLHRHYDLTEALFELPQGVAVARACLDPVRVAVLDRAPPGVVRHTSQTVERLWRPALTVTGIVGGGADTLLGLHQVGVFCLDGPRGVAILRRPRTASLARATRLGVGVAVPAGAGCWELAAPPGRQLPHPSPQHWRFLEAVYTTWQHTAGCECR